MCIRSKHGAITAWCAAIENIVHNKVPTSDSHLISNHSNFSKGPVLSIGPRTPSSTFPIGIYRCIIFCLLLITHSPTFAATSSSAGIDRRNMMMKSNGFGGVPTHFPPLLKHSYRRRTKRAAVKRPERHLWTPDLVTFVCDELIDPCTRAAFLRRHAYHEICSDLPPLYLLPHIDDVIEGSNQSSTKLCNSKDKGVRSTDGLYWTYLETPSRCRKSLEALDVKIRSSLNTDLDMFVDILERSFCILANSTTDNMLDECVQCRKAYWSWVCTTAFPIFYPLAKLPILDVGEEVLLQTSSAVTTTPIQSSIQTTARLASINKSYGSLQNASVASSSDETPLSGGKKGKSAAAAMGIFVLEQVPACMSWCTQVETLCPYFNPSDSTSNGGEPTFLCDESHYQYAPPDNPHSVNYYTGCEFDCCFTEQDLLIDVVLDEFTSSSPSHSAITLAEHLVTDVPAATMGQADKAKGNRNDKVEEEYFSLTERCLHQQLSERLRGGGSPILVDRVSSRKSSSAAVSILQNAFFSVSAAIVVVAIRLG